MKVAPHFSVGWFHDGGRRPLETIDSPLCFGAA
jgi:hypothetical protein